jgi:hypothetical protein
MQHQGHKKQQGLHAGTLVTAGTKATGTKKHGKRKQQQGRLHQQECQQLYGIQKQFSNRRNNINYMERL